MSQVRELRSAGARAADLAADPSLTLDVFDRESGDLAVLLARGGRLTAESNSVRHAAGLLDAIRRRDRSTLWAHGFRQSTPEGATRAVLQTVSHLAGAAARKPLRVRG